MAGHHVAVDHHRVPLELDARHRAQEVAVGILAEREHDGVGLQRFDLAGRLRAAVVVERMRSTVRSGRRSP